MRDGGPDIRERGCFRSGLRVACVRGHAQRPGEHVEVDAQEHLDLVRRLDVTRTPTILVLDGHGRVAQRAHGVPSAQQIMTALSRHLPAEGPGPAHVG